MDVSKDYGQYCGLARALDVVGDRWNLLIVRQLLIRPARYSELRSGLPGVATNLLAGRLRELEAAGVIERRLADDADGIEYALTPWGRELREPIEGLIRWSTPLMTRGPQGDQFRAEWLELALPAVLADRPRPRRAVSIRVELPEGTIVITSTRSGFEFGGSADGPVDAVIRTGADVLLGVAVGMLPVDSLDIDGDRSAVSAVFDRSGIEKQPTGPRS
ncbi:helix-turn-helix domain-containing protein [Gordonia sp. VNQ95]|uniref:winged helix-turn-helix transcriptional regulator n=1 Tax=Gordonia TaxID=2053 RepID=UPI0032B467AB